MSTPTPAAKPADTKPAATKAADTKPVGQKAAEAAHGEDGDVIAKTADTVDAKAGTYTVAPGRTVTTGDDSFGAGGRVKLTAEEANRLLKTGFILDKDGAAIIQADGPAVDVEDGVQVAT